MRRGRSEQEADDLVHDAWIRLTQFSLEHPVADPEAFLMRTAINLSIDAQRAQVARGEQLVLEDMVIVDMGPSTDDVVLARERLARVLDCLASMTEKTRSIFLAHKIEGMSYKEIADHYGITRSAVEKHVSKGILLTASWMEGW